MATVTITKTFDEKVNEQFTQEMFDEADLATVKRQFFTVDTVYGGEGDPEGKWEAKKVKLSIQEKDGNGQVVKTTYKVVWAACYTINGEAKDNLSKSFLLAKSRYDVNGNRVPMLGSIREWADKNIVGGILDKEWTAALAKELNEKGMKLEKIDYQAPKKDGGKFTAIVHHPYFAKD
jgi:hypothetical protein